MTDRVRTRARRTRAATTMLLALLAACRGEAPTEVARIDTGARRRPADADLLPLVPIGEQPKKIIPKNYAYLLADNPISADYAPDPADAYNGRGGSIRVQRFGVGQYRVTFDSPAPGWPQQHMGFAVTAVAPLAISCTLWGSQSTGYALGVSVQCYDRVTNAYADSRFSLLAVGPDALAGRYAYALTSLGGDYPSYTPDWDYSYTSSLMMSSMLVKYNTLTGGDFSVNLAIGASDGMTTLVTAASYAAGDDAGICKLREWQMLASRVVCFDGWGQPRTLMAWVLQVERGAAGRQFGFAFANQTNTAVYAPHPDHSYNSSGGTITVTRSNIGRYVVEFAGLHQLAGETMNVQVTPVGVGLARCNVVSKASTPTGLQVGVECRGENGAFGDSRFNVLVIQ